MKKKLHISFWALGIAMLLLSQLIALVPASHAYAAAPSLDDYNTSARKYSAYAAFHECLLKVPSGYKTSGTELGQGKIFSGLGGISLVVIGYINDIGSGDGTVFCDEAAQKWYEQAGYSDVSAMMTDLGFVSTSSTGNCGGVTNQQCTTTDWQLNVAPSVLSSNHQTLAKSRKIPVSMVGTTGVKYSLAVAALQSSSCGATLTPATAAGPDTVALLTDSSGAISYKSINWGSTSGSAGNIAGTGNTEVTAFPDPVNSNTSGSKATCSGLVDYLNSTSGTSYFAAAMVAERINATSSDIATAACAKAGITDKAKLATCMSDFTGWAKACMKDYYTNKGYSPTFDVSTVASCVYGKMNASSRKSWYKKITLADLTTIIQQGMDANTPVSVTGTTDDPCSLLPTDTQMRWLACSLLLGGKGIADAFFAAIQSLLYTPTDALFNADSFKTMASTFRIIGMALLIIIGLVMIIAQASGSDIVDAYTVKKVLPKIGIALIGMALAWPLLKLVVGGTNDIAIGLGSFVKDLAGSGTTGSATNSGDVVSLIATGIIGGGAGTAIMVVSLGAWGILSLLGTVILALLIGLAVLAFRQLLIVMLILVAPLAIAASVMPGTDKLWKFWRTTLLSTLMMFPIIMLFLSSGSLMASIFGKMDGDKTINSLMAVLVYFAPYFMLPFAFKMAGGLMANIFQIANDKGKGAFDRLRNQRGEIRKDRLKRAGSGHLWDKESGIQKAFKGNAVASWIGDPAGTGAYTMRHVPGFRRAGSRIENKIAMAQNEQTGKLADEMMKSGYNDRAFRVISGAHAGLEKSTKKLLRETMGRDGNSLYGRAITNVGDLEKVASILGQSMGDENGDTSGAMGERTAAGAIRSSLGRLSTLNMDSEVGKASIAGAGIMGLAAQGYATPDDMAGAANNLVEQMGEQGAHPIITQAINLASKGRPDIKAGYTILRDAKGKYMSSATTGEGDNRINALLLRQTSGDFAGAKPDSWEAFAPSAKYNLESGDINSPNVEAQIDQLANLIGPYSPASPAYKAEVLKFVRTRRSADGKSGISDRLRNEILTRAGKTRLPGDIANPGMLGAAPDTGGMNDGPHLGADGL